MAKFAIIASALAVLAPLASARNCTPNLVYCGSVLLEIGNYDGQITEALLGNSRPADDNWKNNSLFCCEEGSNNGDIQFITKCDSCKNGGTGHDDHC